MFLIIINFEQQTYMAGMVLAIGKTGHLGQSLAVSIWGAVWSVCLS